MAGNVRMLEYKGEILPLGKMAEKHGIKPVTLSYRLNNGWPLERALEEPLQHPSKGRPRRSTRQKRETLPGVRRDGRTVLITFEGETLTLTATAKKYGIAQATLSSRLFRDGLSVKEALTKPLGRGITEDEVVEEPEQEVKEPKQEVEAESKDEPEDAIDRQTVVEEVMDEVALRLQEEARKSIITRLGSGPFAVHIAMRRELVDECKQKFWDRIAWDDPKKKGYLLERRFQTEEERYAYVQGLEDGKLSHHSCLLDEDVFNLIDSWGDIDEAMYNLAVECRSAEGEHKKRLHEILLKLKKIRDSQR